MQDDLMQGILVRRSDIDSDYAGEAYFTSRTRNPFSTDKGVDTHRVFPMAQASALLSLADILRIYRETPLNPSVIRLLMDVLQCGTLDRALGIEEATHVG